MNHEAREDLFVFMLAGSALGLGVYVLTGIAVSIEVGALLGATIVVGDRARRARVLRSMRTATSQSPPRVCQCSAFCVACAEALEHQPIPEDEAHCHCYVRGGAINHCRCSCHGELRS